MLGHILRTDWKNLAGDRTLYAVVLLFTLLLGYGAYNGAQWTAALRTTQAEAAADNAARLAKIPERMLEAERTKPISFYDPRNATTLGAREANPYLSLPPAPLAPLAVGQSDLYPSYVRISLQSADNVLSSDEIENPNNLLSGRFDLAFVLVYLYPLLILALTYNLLSGEKEQGTLALTLSQPVHLSTLVGGKLAARATLLFTLAVGLSGVAAALGGASPLSLDFLLWVLVVAVYGLFWMALAVLVNAANLSSAANALVLSAVWVTVALIVPGTVSLLANTLHPVPSRVEMIQAMRDASKEASQKGSLALARFLEDHPDLAPGGENAPDPASTAYAVQVEVERRMEPVLARFDEQIAGQRRIVERFQYLSPTILAQVAFNNLAGTGTERYEHFRRQVTTFLGVWRDHFAKRIFAKQSMGPADLASLPRFRFAEEAADRYHARTLLALLGIAVPGALLAALGLRQLGRYRVSA
ncbi:MAG: DUF3526 domain-containing protein [Bryobacter sp.]